MTGDKGNLHIHMIPVLSDNYAYCLIDSDCGKSAIVDPGDAAPVIAFCEDHGIHPDYILNTHHHGDHTGGNADIRKRYHSKVAAPAAEIHKIGHVDIPLRDGDTFMLGTTAAQIIATPGHTAGHVVFYFPEDSVLFSGDTLFAMGCGRLFEGDANDMWAGLQKLNNLPDETRVYCGHEYTQSNAASAISVMPDNHAILKRHADVTVTRQSGKPTIPTTLGLERLTNPFLMATDAGAFATLRRKKDSF